MVQPDISGLIKKYLSEGKVMQLATVRGDQPWVCSVHYTVDEEHNLYWLSTPARRHSQELTNNSKVAITIPLKLNVPVIGLGAEGIVDVINDADTVAEVMNTYTKRHGTGKDFHANFVTGTNQHHMYRFKPIKFILVDEVNHPSAGSMDWLPKAESRSAHRMKQRR